MKLSRMRWILAAMAVVVFFTQPLLAAEKSQWPNLKQVIVVFKTHFDIGYTDLPANVLQKYRTTMIDRALATCDATSDMPADRQFVWTLPGWPLAQILYPGQEPARRERVLDAMKSGRFVWHALPVTMHTESIELEDITRGLGFSSRLSRSLNLPLPRDAKMTDVPEHCWALPTILANAGVEFMHIGTNGASTPPDAPILFNWKGPDGSKVLTMLVRGYGTGLTPPKDWPYQTWLALMHTGDNHGPPTPQELAKLLKHAAKELPGVKLHMGRMSDFADAIRRENPALPEVAADMPDTWIHGIMSMPLETGLARRVRPQIGQLEALNTLLKAWHVAVPDLKATVAEAYEQSLLYGEHTWGMDAKRFPRLYGKAWRDAYTKGTFTKMEESWAEHGNYIRRTAQLVEPALAEHLQKLGASVAVDGQRVVVYNPLPWMRDDVVTIKLPTDSPVDVRDASSNDRVLCQQIDGAIRFVARGVPSMGYKTYVVERDAERGVRDAGEDGVKIDAAAGTIENAHLRLKIDAARGGIVEWLDKQTQRQLIDARQGPLGQYLYERFDADDARRFLSEYTIGKADWIDGDFGKPGLSPASQAPHSISSATGLKLQMHCGPVCAQAILTASPSEHVPHATKLTITVYRDSPDVDLEWTILDKKPTPWPEAGWLRLPLAVEQPQFRLARLGAVVDPAKDLQPGSNSRVFCLDGGISITGQDGSGVGLCSADAPLISLGEPGLWHYDRNFKTPEPTVLLNLFNNVWSTNFAQWSSGTWSTHVRLWPVRHGDTAGELIVPSWDTRAPLLAATADGSPGSLPPTVAGLALSRPGVLITAFGPNPDGAGTLLRIWDQSGQGGRCRVELPSALRFAQAQRCDLRGQPSGSPLPLDSNHLDLVPAPFGPASVILRTAR